MEHIFIKKITKGIIYGENFKNESLNEKGIYILPNEYSYLVNLKWKIYSIKRKITNNDWNEKIFDIISFEE